MTFIPDAKIVEIIDELLPILKNGDREAIREETDPKKWPDWIRPSSIDLHVGDEVFISGDSKISYLGSQYDREDICIQPGDFAIILTKEYVKIPNDLMGLVNIKTGIKNSGLINISGFQVDPGFEGKLTFSLYNVGIRPIVLRRGEKMFIMFLTKLDGEPKRPYNEEYKYHRQEHISSEQINKLTGKTSSPSVLDQRITKLEHTMTLVYSIGVGLLIGMIVLLLRTVFGGK